MRKMSVILFLFLGLALILCPASIRAACTQVDASGTWRVYTLNDIPGWLYCTVRINDTGTVASGTYCINSDGDQIEIDGGKITVSPGCTLKGYFDLSDGYGTKVTIDYGAMGRDKIYVEGVGHDNWQGIFKFSGVKK